MNPHTKRLNDLALRAYALRVEGMKFRDIAIHLNRPTFTRSRIQTLIGRGRRLVALGQTLTAQNPPVPKQTMNDLIEELIRLENDLWDNSDDVIWVSSGAVHETAFERILEIVARYGTAEHRARLRSVQNCPDVFPPKSTQPL